MVPFDSKLIKWLNAELGATWREEKKVMSGKDMLLIQRKYFERAQKFFFLCCFTKLEVKFTIPSFGELSKNYSSNYYN